jgi:hypothetical protein
MTMTLTITLDDDAIGSLCRHALASVFNKNAFFAG